MTKLLTVTNGPTWPGNAALPAGGTKVGTVTFRPTARLASGSDTTLGLSIADVYVDNTGALVLRGQAGPNAPFRLLGGLRAPGSVQPPTYAVEERLVIGGKAIEQRFTVTPFEDLPGGGGTWNYRSSAPDVKFVSAPPSFASDIAAVQQTVAQAQQQAQQAAASAAGSAAIVAAGANAGRRIAAGTLGMPNLLRGYNQGTASLSDDAKSNCTLITYDNVPPTPLSRAAVPKMLGLVLTPPANDPTCIWGTELESHPAVLTGQTLRVGFWVHRNHLAVNKAVLGAHLHLCGADGALLANLQMAPLTVNDLATAGTAKVTTGTQVTVTDVTSNYSFVQLTYTATVAAQRVRFYLLVDQIVLSAVIADRHAFFLNLTYLGHAEQPVDPYTVYPDAADAAGQSAPRRTGGTPGLVVDTGTSWVKATTQMTTQLLLSGVLDARGRIVTAGEYADVTGWNLLPATPYYLTDTSPYNLSPVPADGIPATHTGTKMTVLITTGASTAGKATEAKVLPPMPEAAPPLPGTYLSATEFVGSYNVDLMGIPSPPFAAMYTRGTAPTIKLTSTEDAPQGEASHLAAQVAGVTKHVYLKAQAVAGGVIAVRTIEEIPLSPDGEYLFVFQLGENNPDNVQFAMTFRTGPNFAYMLKVLNGWHVFQEATLSGASETITTLANTGNNNPGVPTAQNKLCLRVRVQGANGSAKLWAYDDTKSQEAQAESEPAGWTIQTTALAQAQAAGGKVGFAISGFSAQLFMASSAPIGTAARFTP